MERINRTVATILISERPDDSRTALDDDSTFEIREVSADRVVDALGSPSHEKPDAIVLELEAPEAIRDALSHVRAALPDVPVVVAPPTGSERAATEALRGGATEYVPTDGTDRVSERVLDALRQPSTSGADGETTYHRVLAEELPDEAFVLDETGTYLEASVRPEAAPLYTSAPDELVGSQLRDVFPGATGETIEACLGRAIETGTTQSAEYEVETAAGPRRFEGRVVPIDRRFDGKRAVVCLARDITDRARREHELQHRRDQLETLNRINRVIRRVIETLVEAPTQSAIERHVCEQLVVSELYCGSWIAERTGEGELSYRTGAGEAESFLDALEERSVAEGPTAHRAVTEGCVQTVDDVAGSEATPEAFREAARTDGVNAGIAVPISHKETVYSILCVLSGRTDAFSEDEQRAFQLLGETIGFAISAVKNRQLLFSDSVLELEFRIDDGETFSFYLSREYGCSCSLEWAGSTADGRRFQYVSVEGLDSETVLEEASTHESVEECRLIHESQDRCTIEIRFRNSGVRVLSNRGATIRDAWVDDGVGGLLIEVPRDANVREIADALKLVYENSELEARREVDRTVRTAVERRKRVLDQLTQRQLTTLRLAYYSGFFDWPRESTGEDVAAAMDISAPTMHQHLRKGLKTVLGEFFDEHGDTI
jgi:HTH-type transcriptional regulator, bacterioopsin transcriptional activator and related proteins